MQQWGSSDFKYIWHLDPFSSTKTCPVAIDYNVYLEWSGTELVEEAPFECWSLCANTRWNYEGVSPFVKSGRWDAPDKEVLYTPHLTENKGVVAGISPWSSLIVLPSWFISIPTISFEVNAIHSICETRCGGSAFPFDEFPAICIKDTSPTFKHQKVFVSLTCTVG